MIANQLPDMRKTFIRIGKSLIVNVNNVFLINISKQQLVLVDSAKMVESELKAKSIRRGLCNLEGRIVVVETQTPESMHDFSQALIDIGTMHAIYLVGSTAIGWSMDMDGNGTKMGLWDERIYKNVSFIVWSK